MQEIYISGKSLIHQIDARVKLILTFALLLFLNLSPVKAWPAYILFFSYILVFIIVSQLPIKKILLRSMLSLPFILAAIPLIITGPEPRQQVVVFNWFSIAISPEGWLRFLSIGIKSWVSVLSAVLLASTTRFYNLVAALSWMKVPPLIIAVIGLMWRYLFIMVDEVTRMTQARASRSATLSSGQKNGGTILWRAKVTGGMAGSLFLRAIDRSGRVYAAMQARGFNGSPVLMDEGLIAKDERLVLVLCLILFSLIWLIGLFFGG